MTEYEYHSLKLLSAIASGISLHLISLNPAMQSHNSQEHSESVLEWQKSLTEILSDIPKTTNDESAKA